MTVNSLVLRTDFSSDGAWLEVCEALQRPVGDFVARVECVSDRAFEGASVEQVVACHAMAQEQAATKAEEYYRTFVFVVDALAIASRERHVLVVGLGDGLGDGGRGRSFRVVPSEAWGVENNLSIANMDFADFADNCDADGVFRGFAE